MESLTGKSRLRYVRAGLIAPREGLLDRLIGDAWLRRGSGVLEIFFKVVGVRRMGWVLRGVRDG